MWIECHSDGCMYLGSGLTFPRHSCGADWPPGSPLALQDNTQDNIPVALQGDGHGTTREHMMGSQTISGYMLWEVTLGPVMPTPASPTGPLGPTGPDSPCGEIINHLSIDTSTSPCGEITHHLSIDTSTSP